MWYGRRNGSRSQINPRPRRAVSTAAIWIRWADRDALVRAVIHRHDHRRAGDRSRGLVHRGLPGADREQHHVRTAGFVLLPLHQLHDLDQSPAQNRFATHRAGSEERREFARAMPGNRRDRQFQIPQHSGDGQVGNQDSEDRRPELSQLGLGSRTFLGCRVKHVAERLPAGVGGELIAPRERLLDFREDAAQIEEHVRVLCTLAGKEQGERALLEERLFEEVDARRSRESGGTSGRRADRRPRRSFASRSADATPRPRPVSLRQAATPSRGSRRVRRDRERDDSRRIRRGRLPA